MPIRPHLRRLYPADWPRLTNQIRFERAAGRCECCGRPHGRFVLHCGDGRWFDKLEDRWRTGHGAGTDKPTGLRRLRLTKVSLATAHLDHDPTNNDFDNLKALCQRCHILYDQPEHRRRRWLTLRSRKALGDLFLGPYVATISTMPKPDETDLSGGGSPARSGGAEGVINPRCACRSGTR